MVPRDSGPHWAMPNICAAALTRDNVGVGFSSGCKEQRLTRLGDACCKDTRGVIRTAQLSWESSKNNTTTTSEITIREHLGAHRCVDRFV